MSPRATASVTLSARHRLPSPYERLKQAIMTGELMPTEPLVESVLSDWCNVSRTPIREALMRLEHDGLVHRTDRGLVVRERSPEEILDIYETRIVNEAAAARVAASRRTTFDIISLRRANENLRNVDVSDENAMAASNRAFHEAVWKASHNDSLVDVLSRLNLHLLRYPATTLSRPGRWAEAQREHAAIVDAIEAREAARAEELSSLHFQAARDIRLQIWAEGHE